MVPLVQSDFGRVAFVFTLARSPTPAPPGRASIIFWLRDTMTPNNQNTGRKRSQQTRERRESFARSVPKATKRVIGRSTTRETPLRIRTPGSNVDDALRDYMRSRAGFKLGKFALSIVRLSVRVEDVAGPSGAPIYDCRFVVVLPGRQIVVAARDSTVRAAFDAAVAATERAVRRCLQRGRARSARADTPRWMLESAS